MAGRDSPPGNQIYCPCPWRLKLSSFPSTPRPSRKQQEGQMGMRAPTQPQTNSATQTGGPGAWARCLLTKATRSTPLSTYPLLSKLLQPTEANTAQEDASPRVLVPWTSAQPRDGHTLPSEVQPIRNPPLRWWRADAHPAQTILGLRSTGQREQSSLSFSEKEQPQNTGTMKNSFQSSF